MICDNCGFEHNSKSTCPKCGARVVYVDEEYLKRKKEWEEAQKNGEKKGMLPGIYFSTKEEHDARKAGSSPKKEEAPGKEPDPADFSLEKVKKFFINVFAHIIMFFYKRILKHRKKKTVETGEKPRYQALFFGDEDEDTEDLLDASALVLSHKIFKDNRKKIFIGAGIFTVCLAALIVLIVKLSTMDTSHVLITADGRSYYAGKDETVEDTPEDLSTFEKDGRLYARIDNKEYALPFEIADDGHENEIIDVTKDGDITFTSMETASYGIVNQRSLLRYNVFSEKTSLLYEGVEAYKLLDDRIFFINESQELFIYETAPRRIDTGVTAFTENKGTFTGKIYYSTDENICEYDMKYDEIMPLFKNPSAPVTIYRSSREYIYYSYLDTLQQVTMYENAREPHKLGNFKAVIPYKEGFSVLYKDGRVCILTDKQEEFATDADMLYEAEGAEDFIIVSGDKVFFGKNQVSYIQEISFDSPLIYSRRCLYYTDKAGILKSIDVKNKELTAYGKVSSYKFCK